MADEQHGIKESLELLKGIELLAKDYTSVMADGKVDLQDLKVAGDIMAQFSQLSDAVKDVSLIGKEVSDLDEGEILQLATAALQIAKAFKKPAA